MIKQAKQALTAAAFAAILATPAFAQSTKPMDSNSSQMNSTTTPMNSTNPQPMNSPAAGAQMNGTQSTAFVQDQKSTDWRSSKLVGTNVYGQDNTKIGDINDILIGSGGNVQAVVVGVGGFLGVGEKNVAIPFDALSITRKANSTTIEKITVSYSKDDLKNAPKFAWYQAQSSQTTGSGMTTTNKDNVKK
jgi:sporulation protein YlmC with PRC-barrel domain